MIAEASSTTALARRRGAAKEAFAEAATLAEATEQRQSVAETSEVHSTASKEMAEAAKAEHAAAERRKRIAGVLGHITVSAEATAIVVGSAAGLGSSTAAIGIICAVIIVVSYIAKALMAKRPVAEKPDDCGYWDKNPASSLVRMYRIVVAKETAALSSCLRQTI